MDTDQTNSMKDKKGYDRLLKIATHIYSSLSAWCLAITIYGCVPFFIYLCISPSLRIFALLYVLWMYYDRRTPYTGGRRLLWMRKSSFWRCPRDYFPIKLMKTAEFPPDTTYLFAAFPHGIWPVGLLVNFCSDLTGFDKAFVGLIPHVHAVCVAFDVPIFREICMALGGVAVSFESILHTLNGPLGNAAVVFVGGVREMTKSSPKTNEIVLKNRKGFVKAALRSGSSLVPVFSFGETDMYDQIEWYQWFQEKLITIFPSGASLPMGKGPCRLGYLFGLLPYHKPITTVGSPIKLPKVQDPSDELVDKFHKIFMQELTALFEKYKVKYDSRGKEATLIIE